LSAASTTGTGRRSPNSSASRLSWLAGRCSMQITGTFKPAGTTDNSFIKASTPPAEPATMIARGTNARGTNARGTNARGRRAASAGVDQAGALTDLLTVLLAILLTAAPPCGRCARA
jgi:hypothetical protein